MASSNLSMRALYESYKQSTNYALSWLWSQLETKPSKAHTSFRSTSEIINAANEIRHRKVPVPASVVSTLRSAIKQRKIVFTSFRNKSESSHEANASHQAFIERLEQVLSILSPLKAQGIVDRISNESPTDLQDSSVNIYNRLGYEYGDVLDNDQIDPSVKPDVLSKSSDFPQAAPVLDDDDFGQWIELSLFIYEMDTLIQYINGYWEEAAKGLMPIALAAALSTFTLHAVDKIAQGHAELAADATEFIQKWLYLKRSHSKIRFTDIPELTCWRDGRLDDQMEFHHIHQILHHMRTMDEYRTIDPNAGKFKSPLAAISRPLDANEIADASPGDENFNLDDWAFDEMQESMRQLNRSNRAISSLEIPDGDLAVCEALLPYIRRLEKEPDSPIPICLVFGMEMLLSSFKAFMWPDHTLNKTNCRLKVLKFARDVKDEVSATVDAMEADTADRPNPSIIYSLLLQQRISDLDGIIKEKRFDLYYQAPWTAGSHMIEILDVARYEGGELCLRTGYLCAVLHLYNALRAVPAPIPATPLLDRLCNAYQDLLFLGTLPTDNFSSHYRRVRGMGFDRDKETGRTDYSKLSTSSRGPRKEQFMHVCLYTVLHNNYFQPDITFWTRVYSPDLPIRPTEAQKRAVNKELHSKTFNVALDKVKKVLLQDFQGDLPPASLNPFAVFRLCLKVLKQLGSAMRWQSESQMGLSDSSIGLKVVDELLEQIVEHLRDDDKRRLLKYWRPTNMAKDVFKNLGSGLKFEDFLWSL